VARYVVPLTRHVLRARDLIDRAYAEPLDVERLAGAAGVSRAHFTRVFKQAYGETPYQYLMSRRIERAKALLRARELSVTEVCFAVGLTSLGSFSTQFRRIVGESPSEYRSRPQDVDTDRLPSCLVRAWGRQRT
jgi:AraC-like DNA-binding protein